MRRSGLRLNIDEVADTLHVSRRTIFRDLKSLQRVTQELGIPAANRSPPRTDNQCAQLRLSLEETIALALSAKLTVFKGLTDVSESINTAVMKLLANLPADERDEAAQLINACTVTEPSVPNLENHDVLRAILAAFDVEIPSY